MAKQKYSKDIIKEIFISRYKHNTKVALIADVTNIPLRSVYTILSNPEHIAEYLDMVESQPIEPLMATLTQIDPDEELVTENIKLAKKVQTFMDRNRIERKSFREFARVDTMLVTQTEALLAVIKERSFEFDTHDQTWGVKEDTTAPIGVIQMSDHHINEVVNDLESNAFDIQIASQRIQKHIDKSLKIFKAYGAQKVLVAMTGDLIKNSQFISEITENSMDRANATILAVELYSQAIQHINLSGFNVVVSGVVGNESRMTERFDTTSFLANESFDMMILKFLQLVFAGKPGVEILPMKNPLKCVVNINGLNLLLVHGNVHGRLASTGSIEKGVEVIKARYSGLGVKIDYVIMGHIHSAYVGDKFSRSSGLPGSNSYSERTLNLNGKASQNSYLFWKDGSIDGYKIDLQCTKGYPGYPLDAAMKKLVIGMRHKAHPASNMSIIASYLV